MKFHLVSLSSLAVVLFGWASGFAALPPMREPLPDFDRRTDGWNADPNAPLPAARQTAVEALRLRLPTAQVAFDPVSGAPKFVSAGDQFLTGPEGQGKSVTAATAAQFAAGDPNLATKAFLQEHRTLFGHGPEALDRARVKREFVTPHSGLRTVVWEQQVDGIPVFESVLISHTTRKGELVNIASQFLPDPVAAADQGATNRPALALAPTISARRAVTLSAQNTGMDIDGSAIAPDTDAATTGPEQRQFFKSTGFKGKAEAKLVWLPMSHDRLRLCWEVVLMNRVRGEMFRVLVDVQTGEALLRHCLTDYISDATYRVYTSDSPSPFSPSWATPNSGQPPLTNRVLVTLPALDTNASPNGWINDGGNETLGNNVDAHTDRNADNVADLPRPQGSPFRVFDFPLDLAQAPTTYTNAAVVQLFYWNNFMHDKLYQLGFTEAAGNFQSNNFGRGGLGNDAVQADAQDGSGYNNANFSTPADGSPGRMQMYIFNGPTPNRDGDLDAEVVLHEYTHGLSNRRVGGGAGISALQPSGMGEGWSDFYAMALLSEASDDVNAVYAYGGYATYQLSGMTQNYYFGIRRYPYCTDTNKNPLTFKDIDTTQASAHTGIPRSSIVGTTANEVHNMGEVWCMTLREARANLITKYGWAIGNQLILQLVTDGMNLSPANPTFLQARDAILQADQVDTGGANLTELWAAFAKRGMGKSATSPASSTTTGVHEAFDQPFQPLQLTVPASATEGDGVLAGAGQMALPAAVSSNVVVQLVSSDTTEVTAPASVTILAGQTNTNFDLTIIDDAILDGTQIATITAAAAGFATVYKTISVFDNETATLSVTLPATATEGQGTVTGTVQVSAVPATNILVSLSSSDTTEIQVPASVLIPGGQTSAVFTATVVDDNQIDGAQIATVTAHVQNWTDGSANITVLDNENLNLVVSLPATAWENAGVLTNWGVVSISGTLATNLPVTLVSDNPARLTVPAVVTIPAGQVSNTINLTLVNNSIADGQTNVTVTASAAGFTNGSASLLVMDDESPVIPSNPQPANLATNVLANTLLQWSNTTNSAVTNELILNGGFESGSLANWTLTNSTTGTFVINNGTVDPPSADGPLPPFAGTYSALGRESGSGTFYMYQTVTIPSNATSAKLSWAHRVRNFYTAFSSSQQFQVRICDTNNAVLATAFTTSPGDTLLQSWVQTNYNLIAQAGKKVRVMFWVNPGSYYFDAHVDSVSLLVTTGTNAGPTGVVTNDVYFGTNPTPGPAELQGSTTNSAWTLPLLTPQTTCYWQIVARKGGTATSPVWQFTTAGVDHFAWNTNASPQFVNQPFSATITAKDAFNTTVTNFSGPVNLSAASNAGAGIFFGDDFEDGSFSDWLNGSGSYTRAITTLTAAGGTHSFTLTGGNSVHYDGISHTLSNITPNRVTFCVRASATNVSGGYFVIGNGSGNANTAVFSYMNAAGMGIFEDVGGAHVVPYVANRWYKVTLTLNWTNKTVDYYVDDALKFSAIPFRGSGVTNLSVVYLYNFNSTQAWWDEITFANGNSPSVLTISPTNSGNFVNGMWSGNVTVQQPATNIVLRADDSNNHSGTSSPFDVVLTNDLSVNVVAAPNPVSVGASLTYRLTVTNTGPTDATGVTLSNLLPVNAAFVSAVSSQGICVQTGGVVSCNLGVVPGGSNAIITLTVAPTIAGVMLTNVATVSRAEADNYSGNNVATSITQVTTPLISIADAAVVEGNLGTTNMIFPVTLAVPGAQTITVNYATADGSATAGSDFAATNGVLTFAPGVTNGTISVAVTGDILVETNETFFVNLSGAVNGTLGRAQAVGTIINDDGFPGDLDHFVWSLVASPQFTGQPFSVTITALDAANNLATNFHGAAALSATAASVVPPGTELFDNGVWSGNFNIPQRATNTVLRVDDGNGHFGLSSPFDVAPFHMPPALLLQPTNQVVIVGQSATFIAPADGTPPLIYQWSWNGTNLDGATNSLLTLTNVQFSQAGTYGLLVTNAYGATASSNALLTVIPQPPTPVILSFSPAAAVNGATVSIIGTNFSPTAASDIVYLGAVRATVSSASATNLLVTVPVGATYAPISVTVAGRTAYSGSAFLPTFIGGGSGISASNFGPGQTLATLNGPYQTVLADLDGDGKPDVIVADDYNNSISIFRNISTNGTLTAASFAPRVTLPATSGSYSPFVITVADVDGDGLLDIVAAEYGDNLVSVYRNTCTPGIITTNSFATRIDFATGAGCQGVAVRDLDGDGKPDIVTANATDGTVSILRNTCLTGSLTTNSFEAAVDLPTGAGCDRVAIGDLNGDGKPDLATANSGTVSVLQNLITAPGSFSTNSFAPKLDLAVPSGSVEISIADIDGDHRPDLLVTAYLPQIFSVIQNLNTGGDLTVASFGPRIDYPLNGRGHTIGVGDLDGDGKPDLVVDTELNSLISIFRNQSTPGMLTNSSLASQVELTGGYNSWGVSVGDLDGDGRPDIIFANSYDNTLEIFQNLSSFGLPPGITAQPAGKTVLGGSNVVFSVSASGTPPLNYFWQKDNLPLTATSNGLLTLLHVTRTNSGSYHVIVSNFVGSVASSNAVLVVHVPQRLGTPVVLPDGTLAFVSSDADGGALSPADLANMQAQASTNLMNWVALPGSLSLTNGVLQFHDSSITNSPRRFYRIMENW